MRRVERIAELRREVAARRARGERVAFVPTMGALHEGHLSLVDRARAKGDAVVMSIFVNPLQFGPSEDLARYPRDLEADAALAAARGVDLLFAPSVEEMYPGEGETRVVPGATAADWEGAIRPGHFAGVLTVVAKLFGIAQPDVAIFGRKDLQQAAVVRRMVRDLDMPVEIDVAPTAREADGLALSSRNRYLSSDERVRALALVRSLQLACLEYAAGEHQAELLAIAGRRQLASSGVEPDYFAIVDPDTMERVERAHARSAAIVAARVGTTRLIDNMILGQPE